MVFDFLYAKRNGEIKEYLRGDEPYRKRPETDFYIPYEPTEIISVIKEVFAYEKNIKNSVDVFIDTIYKIVGESAVETYLVFDYLWMIKYANNRGWINIKKYERKIEKVERKLIKHINIYEEELKEKLIFPNGWEQENAWEDIVNRCDDRMKKMLNVKD